MSTLLKASSVAVSFLFMASVQAQNLRIVDFTGQYRAPSGTGQAQFFQAPPIKSELSSKSVTVRINRNNNGYVLRTPTSTWEFVDPPSLLDDVETAQWQSVHASLTAQQLAISFGHFQTQGKAQSAVLNQFSALCNLAPAAGREEKEVVLDGCLNRQAQLRLKMVELTQHNKSAPLVDLVNTLNALFMIDGDNTALSSNRFDNIELNVNGNNFDGKITTRVVINATVRLNGKTYYDADQKLILVRIDSARAGIFNVTGTLFDELNKISSPNMRVERPWVIVDLAE